MTEWTHCQVAVGFEITAYSPVEIYERSWRERLLSWPWRPWVRQGVRPSIVESMRLGVERAHREMESVAGISSAMYGDRA